MPLPAIRPAKLALAVLLGLIAGSAASGTQPWQAASAPPPMPAPGKAGFAEVDGIRMYYALFGIGRGSPVLLLHGGLGSSDMWGAEVPVLARTHEVIVADSRGQGRSTWTGAPLSYGQMADDTVALLDALGMSRVAVVGHSDGGIVGLDMAMRHPGRVTKLFAQAANATVGGLIGHDDMPPGAAPSVEAASAPADIESAVKRLWDTQPAYTAADLAAIRVPTAIAVGDHDEYIRPEHSAWLARTIPGARLVILKDAGHLAPEQDPAQFTAAVLAFLGG